MRKAQYTVRSGSFEEMRENKVMYVIEQAKMNMRNVKRVVEEDVIEQLGFGKLPKAKQLKLLDGIRRAIYETVLMRIMESLDESGRARFVQALHGAKDEAAINAILEANAPNIDAIIKDEVARFKKEGIEFLKKLR